MRRPLRCTALQPSRPARFDQNAARATPIAAMNFDHNESLREALQRNVRDAPVSYTHLTLPTSDLV